MERREAVFNSGSLTIIESHPSYPCAMGLMELAGIATFIYSAQSFAGKILSGNGFCAVEFPALQTATAPPSRSMTELANPPQGQMSQGSTVPLWISGYYPVIRLGCPERDELVGLLRPAKNAGFRMTMRRGDATRYRH